MPNAFYLVQADQQLETAGQATLTNVRDRCERAAQAWSSLTARGQSTSSPLIDGASENPDRGSADG